MNISISAPRPESHFWEKVSIAHSPGACWEWQRGCGSHGYGQYYEEGKSNPVLAHRHAWAIARGPIPSGKFVLHHCDNKRCVRPAHLFLGTQGDNMADALQKGRRKIPEAKRGELSPTAKITDAQASSIARRLLIGSRQRPGNALELAIEHGITRARVYQIAKRAA